MIKIFRNIRKILLLENKFTKYLLYAIGEIVLVVIGILIALQINNRNEANKLKKRELVLLAEMRVNLESDLKDLSYNLHENKKRIASNEAIKHAIDAKLPFHDSLKYHFGNVFGNFQLTENVAAWENLKSVGLDLISDDTLRNAISNLYSNRYAYLENMERGLDDRYQWDYFYPQVLKHLSIDTLWVSGNPRNYESLMDDAEFLEVLKMHITVRKVMQENYEKTEALIHELVRQIDYHIQRIEQ
jgi:hypothetical protein